MRVIEVLGPGCANCLRLEMAAGAAVDQTGIEAEIRKVSDYQQILAYGVMSTPGLVIDGSVVSTGRVPAVDEIASWLRASVPAAR